LFVATYRKGIALFKSLSAGRHQITFIFPIDPITA
jgi:hypothetical protein